MYFIGEACDDTSCTRSEPGVLPYVFKFCSLEIEDWSSFTPSPYLAIALDKLIGEMLNVIKSSANMF